MHKSLALVVLSAMLAFASQASTAAAEGNSSVLLGYTGWEAFADSGNLASFAWAGEDETFSVNADLLGKAKNAVIFDDEAYINPELLTGLPAPEPPALVLAGMAFGGVLCGRSFLMRRRKTGVEGCDAETV